jgi:signal transduction histidine kinase
MKQIKSVLLVEDNAGDARLLREMFKEHPAMNGELTLVACMSEAERHLSEHSVDVILLDLGLPDVQGLEAIRRARAAAPGVPLVVLTGLDDEALASRALQEGTQDYLIKGQIEARGLLRALRYAVERKRLDRLKDEFISTVSHELRTPLTSISASLGLLMCKTAGELPEAAARLIAIAHSNGKRLVRLVNDILDIEKMESGRVVFDFRRVEVRLAVEQAIEVNRGFAAGCNVRIRLERGRDVGDVRADPDRLAQVIANVVSNAIKFSPANDEVVIALDEEAEVVRISVRDHGPGISADFWPHIFERFAQADGTNARRKGGTGLGLSIVKQIVERLGGEVAFADAPGGGTIFHLALPRWDHVAGMAIDADPTTNGQRVLLCEDDLETAVGLRRQLRQVGFSTDFAYLAGDAIAHAGTTQYSAILVDLQLPDGDGISLIVGLRNLPRHRDTPIIVLSADPGRGRDDLRAPTLKVLDWLNKPVDFARLVGTLARSAELESGILPRLLHVDDDDVVAEALRKIADVVSVKSLEEARRALKAHDFDLAVLGLVRTARTLDLLPDFRNSNGDAVPVIVFHGASIRSQTSMDSLVANVTERLASRRPVQRREIHYP